MTKLVGQILFSKKTPNIDTPVVYCISNLINGNEYVGATTEFKKRISAHKTRLSMGKHHSPNFQSDFNQYGVDAFSVSVLVYTDTDNIHNDECEQIRKRKPMYNINSIAPSNVKPLKVAVTESEQKEMFLLRRSLWGYRDRVAMRIGMTSRAITWYLSPKRRYLNREVFESVKRELEIIKMAEKRSA